MNGPYLYVVEGGSAFESAVRQAAAAAISEHASRTTDAHGGIVATTDGRLSDARTPTAHKTSHATGGSDALTPADVGALAASAKEPPGGAGSLDQNGKQPLTEVNAALLGGARRQGTWDASLGAPPAAGLGDNDADRGKYWEVSVAGTTILGGKNDWNPGDWIIWEGSDWGWVDNTDRVGSVDGRQGAVDLSDRYAPASHVGAGGASHAAAVANGSAGFLTGSDKAKIDGFTASGYVSPSLMEGLSLRWDGRTALTLESGAAYVPGLASRVREVASPISKTGLALAASTWYFAYLFDNQGAPDFELVPYTPAVPNLPVLYRGTAAHKPGDGTRRYVGTVLSNAAATPGMLKFRDYGGVRRWLEVLYVRQAGVGTTDQTVDCSAYVPPTTTDAALDIENRGTDRAAFVSTADIAGDLMTVNPASGRTADEFALTASRTLTYRYGTNPTAGGMYVSVLGYREGR